MRKKVLPVILGKKGPLRAQLTAMLLEGNPIAEWIQMKTHNRRKVDEKERKGRIVEKNKQSF